MTEPIEGRVRVPNVQGLHARPSALIVKCASVFAAEIYILNTANGVEADAKRLMEVMMLAAGKGVELRIEAEGPDAESAIQALTELVERGFDDD